MPSSSDTFANPEGGATRILAEQWGHLFPWSPVCLGAGIAIYFALPVEPGGTTWLTIAILALCASVAGLAWRSEARVLFFGLALVASGLLIAGWRTADVAGPSLSYRYYGPIEGRVVAVDRSQSDAVRLTLDQVRLERVSPARTPLRVRVSLHGMAGDFHDPSPGDLVMMTGHLGPPSGPVEPGGFDFRRHAFYLGIGAVGYTRTPLLSTGRESGRTAGLMIAQVRFAISARVREVLPGRTGAFAAAVTMGDRSAMDAATLQSLRDANLAHLLAISGLHMGMLTGFVFAVLRLGLAAWPRAALFWPIRKIAATGGLIAGAGYLALSGGNVATERAFIMVAVMLAALLFDRRAISLRSVALAALVVLFLRPEALLGPGFQMSFAATTGLVAVFEWLSRGPPRRGRSRVMHWLAMLLLTSFVAGLATAPFAAAHFNRVPHYGLIANVFSVPMMGFVVMPGAVLSATLAPLGLEWIGLAMMAPGIDWILWVADRVAGLPGSVSSVKSAPSQVVGLIALGGLILALWRGPWRAAGLPVLGAALALWVAHPRPPLLVAESGKLIGVMTETGRALSKPRGDGFSADSWLENDGDAAGREAASARQAFDVSGKLRRVSLGGAEVMHATGKTASALALEGCAGVDLVVVDVRLGDLPPAAPECDIYDATRLRASGSLAVSTQEGRLTIEEATAQRRPWTGWRP